MVALSFQKQFRAPIQEAVKRHTLRDERRNMPKPGDPLQLYTGMRTIHCRLIGLATCVNVLQIRLDFEYRRVEYASGHAITTPDETDAFAEGDGFPGGWREMEQFWAKAHGRVVEGVRLPPSAWSGFMIQWGDTLKILTEEEEDMRRRDRKAFDRYWQEKTIAVA